MFCSSELPSLHSLVVMTSFEENPLFTEPGLLLGVLKTRNLFYHRTSTKEWLRNRAGKLGAY